MPPEEKDVRPMCLFLMTYGFENLSLGDKISQNIHYTHRRIERCMLGIRGEIGSGIRR